MWLQFSDCCSGRGDVLVSGGCCDLGVSVGVSVGVSGGWGMYSTDTVYMCCKYFKSEN